jgi:hypothetical protein
MLNLQKHISKAISNFVGDKLVDHLPEIQVRPDTKTDWDYSSPSATSILNQFKSTEGF